MKAKEIEELLRGIIDEFHNVKLAYLFGSYAEGKAMPASDIDLALLLDDVKIIPYISARIAKVIGIPEGEISILNLEKATPSLVIKVAKGIKLVDKDGSEERLLNSIPLEVVEVIEEERGAFYLWLYGNPIDEKILRSIISQVSEDISYIEGLVGDRTGEEISRDEDLRRAFERAIHTSIEGMIDLLRHLIAGLNLGIVEFYKDYVEIAERSEVISKEVAETLLRLIPARHMLVHRYRGLNYEWLYEGARTIVEIWPKLLEQVRNYLKGRADRLT